MRTRHPFTRTIVRGLCLAGLVLVAGCTPDEVTSGLGVFLKDLLLGAIAALLF